MAIKIPIITELQDGGIRKAKREFDKFKGAIAEAEGTMGKFKAGGKAAFDSIKANAALFAVSAAASIATFAAKGVVDLQKLAIAAGKFADATGLAVDESSRWIEVAGDVGVEAGTLETAIGKMNKVLGTTPDKFKELGVQVAYTNTGAVNANETFLNVIDRLNKIKDPAERARVASELLGKGWQSMSELIGQGSDKLRDSLKSVSDAKVINQTELERARRFREQLDELGDKASDAGLVLGETLLPVVMALVDAFLLLADAIKKAGDFLDFMPPVLNKIADVKYIENVKKQNDAWKGYYDSLIAAEEATQYLITGLDDTTDATHDLNTAWEQLMGQFKIDDAMRNAQRAIEDIQEAAAAAFSDPSKVIDYQEAVQGGYEAVANLIEIIGLTNAEQNRIKVMVDTGDIEAAIRLLDIMSRHPGTSLTDAMRFRGGRASGGPVTAGGTYLVGERGPELLTMGASSGYITPSGAGSTINVTVTSADPNQVVAAIQQWTRNNGAIPLTTTTNVRR